jgi:hypothetical protein
LGLMSRIVKNWDDRKISLRFYDAISRLSRVEMEADLPTTHFALIPFDSTPDDIEDGIVLHFRGSSPDLTDRALAGLLMMKADVDTQHMSHVSVSTRRALQLSLCAASQEDATLKKWIQNGAEKSAPNPEEFRAVSESIAPVIADTGSFPVVQLFEESKDVPHPSDYILQTLRDWVPKPHGITGIPLAEESRQRLIGRPEEVIASPEWRSVFESRGSIDPSQLTSIFSVLMALVLRQQGNTIDEYARISNEIRVMNPQIGIKRVVPTSTVAVEFSILKRHGWVNIKNRRIYLSDKARKLLG